MELTPGGTVKLCAAPVKEKLHVTAVAASEQPGGTAAAAGAGSARTPTAASQTPARRPVDATRPPDCTAPEVMPLPSNAAGPTRRTSNGALNASGDVREATS